MHFRIKYSVTILLANLVFAFLYAQNCNKLQITQQSQIPASCNAIPLTMLHDQQDKPYLYVANKEAGLKIYDVTDLKIPKLVATVSTKSFSSLHVMNLTQDGNYIYLAIGNHFNNKQSSGMAIVDVSDPGNPVFNSYWTLPSSTGGSGVIKVQGNYAYLGSMGNGLLILDINNKKSIKFVSQFIPEINYPDPKPKKSLFNARGMQVKDDLVYLCYDAGGLRIINTKDKTKPVEIGHFANPVMNGLPRAYNNIVVDDSLAYIAVDYCGMEVLSIKNPANITTVGWWNPYGCPRNNWFKSPIHANEIAFDKKYKLIFLSTGKSDLDIVNVLNPATPVLCKEFGGPNNGIGTWGVSIYKSNVFLSYICSVIPFASNWTGVKILTYENCQ
jgi:LVIVD repeat